MAYQVFLNDGLNTVELDTENIDIKLVFSIADIEDIAARKDKIKAIQFKGTKTNNNAFGSMFDLGRTSDVTQPSNLFFNYNPIKSVLCLVYEDSELIFKGSLRVSQITVDKIGGIIYDTITTGSVIDFKNIVQDRTLTDLDFSDLRHRYSMTNIQNSWDTTTERYNTSTSAYTTSTFAFGSGYTYPQIDYGNVFINTGITQNSYVQRLTANHVPVKNFKPAVYVTEYMNRIFSQSGLTGYSYSISASDSFVNMFNHLVVPDAQEGNVQSFRGGVITYSKPSPLGPITDAGRLTVARNTYKLMAINSLSLPAAYINSLQIYGGYSDVLFATRNFTSNGKLVVGISATNNQLYLGAGLNGLQVIVQLVKRTAKNNNNANDSWAVVAQNSFTINYNQTIYQDVTVDIGETSFLFGEQVAVRININVPYSIVGVTLTPTSVSYSVSSVVLSVPKDEQSIVRAELIPAESNLYADAITPQPPVSVKQNDFLKGLINQFNFYVYADNDNHKHIIFEKYDDYYALTQPQYLLANALDFSSKIDYSNGFTIKSNLSLPKAYLFTNKTDADYFNELYTKRYTGEAYGQFQYNDSYGLVDVKKVELPFSSLIVANTTGTDRLYPWLYKDNSGAKQVTKTNIRLGFYNGIQACQNYQILGEAMVENVAVLSSLYSGITYPQISNYYLSGGTPVYNLHFGTPKEYYFSADINHVTASTSYDWYINQITDLTNPNLSVIECNALLNESDIANLDTKVPIYLNTGSMNGAYFKILSVSYEGSQVFSKLVLQKIAF